METNELLKSALGGIVTGFTIGIGFILAQKLMGRFEPKQTVAPAPSPNEVPPAQSFNGHSNYNGKKKRRFDLTTGKMDW